MIQFVKSVYMCLIALGNFLQPVILLAMRLYWGWEFLKTGIGKFKDIDSIIDYFASLGIPFPTVNAYAAASVETTGGFCLIIGLASRLISLPLMVVMIVAYLTAHYDSVVNILEDPQAFTQETPFNFLLTSLLIFAFGPGTLSLDAFLKRFVFKRA